MQIYFSKAKTKYYSLDKEESCSKCDKELVGVFYLKNEWFLKRRNVKKPMQDKLFCVACVQKEGQKILGEYQDLKLIVIANSLPSDAVPVIKMPPRTNLAAGDLTVFDVANDNSVNVGKDNTKLSGKESIEGASIGNPDMDLLEEKDAEISKEDGLDLLNDLFSESKQIEENKNKELEEKKEDGEGTEHVVKK